MTYVWPFRLLTPRAQLTRMTGRLVTGGASLSGIVQTASISGGGRWVTTLRDIPVHSEDQYRALRAWSAYLDEGVQTVVVPVWDLRFSPRGYAGERIEPQAPEPGANYFSWSPGYAAALITAHATSSAALRATALSAKIDAGTPLQGGEHFSIDHPTKGWRLYRVARAGAPDGSGVQALEIRPPLREAVSSGTSLEFDVPRCCMTADPATALDMEPETNMEGLALVSASFVEAF